MNLQSIFSSILINDRLDIDNQSLKDLSYQLKNQSPGRHFSNMGGWQSNFIDTMPEVKNLIEQINLRLEALREIINFKPQFDLKVETMWININSPYSYNTFHTHPNSYISGSYYVEVPQESGRLEFKHPSVLQALNTPQHAIDHYNEFNSSKWNIPPATGQLVMFPGWLEHGVSQNLSDSDRISIAFNTEFIDNG